MASQHLEGPAPAGDETAPAGAAPGELRPGKGAAARPPESPATAAFRVALPQFEGPLDLLLHLIREHRIDIFDIPIALITEKYLAVIKAMKELDLDVAGEMLVMAATLAHIKSRMLLPDPAPATEEPEEQGDPREELVRRLLTYQKYRAAAEELARNDLLDRDVFTRRAVVQAVPLAEGELGLVEVSVFKLVESLARLLREAKTETPHQVFIDRVSITETITAILERLRQEPRTAYSLLLEGSRDRQRIVVTFLALLELCKMRLVRIAQEEDGGEILVWARDPDALSVDEVKDDYR